MPSMIARVESVVLRAPSDVADLDSDQETLLVMITDTDGVVGVGEADSSEEATQAVIHRAGGHGWSRSLAKELIGRDPFLAPSIFDRLRTATQWTGHAGVAGHAISALDIALHDLAGKQIGRPVYELLGGPVRDRVQPYATCWVGNPSEKLSATEVADRTFAMMVHAVEAGFTAVKCELLMGALATDGEIVGFVAEARRVVGSDVALLLDFGYRWTDWHSAVAVASAIEKYDIYLLEAALQPEDLIGHAKLASRTSIRVGGAEMASSFRECLDWLEIGGVSVLQADVARAGGFTQLRRIASLAEQYGATVIPHCWRTGINAAAARHLHAATANVPMIEFLSSSISASPLRQTLVRPEPTIDSGSFPLGTDPGLGIEIDAEVVDRFALSHLVEDGDGTRSQPRDWSPSH